MSTRCTAGCLVLAIFALAQSAPRVNGAQPSATGIDFNRQIRPLLSENCFACHGPDDKQRKARLRLDTKAGAFAELRNGGFALVSGKPDDSELLRRLTSTDPAAVMPPPKTGKRLTPE